MQGVAPNSTHLLTTTFQVGSGGWITTSVAESLAGWKGSIVLVSHDTDFVRALRPDRALLMPDGDVDHWSDDLLDVVALA